MRRMIVPLSLLLPALALADEAPKTKERSSALLLVRSVFGLSKPVAEPSAPIADSPIAKAYLLRGFYGVFSTGMDDLAKELQAKDNIPCRIDLHTAHEAMARSIIDEHRRSIKPPLILIVGHSYGADDAVQLTRRLHDANVPVSLLATIDPVAPHKVPSNVNRAFNIYKSKKVLAFVPAWRGVALEAESDLGDDLRNIDIRDHPGLDGPSVTHSSIDDQPQVQKAILEEIRKAVRTSE